MTIGENIQYHRKRLGMSQEELGQKLYLSRQTVSLWEKDQTAPTLDNLLRLREIFGITVDELLGVGSGQTAEEVQTASVHQADAQTAEEQPVEHYVWLNQEQNLEEFRLLRLRRSSIGPMIAALILATLSFGMFLNGDLFLGLFALGGLIAVLTIFILHRRRERRAWSRKKAQLLATKYEYCFFEDRMTVRLDQEDGRYRNDSVHQLVQVRYDQVRAVAEGENYLLYLKDEQEPYILPKEQVVQDSLLLSRVPMTFVAPQSDFGFLWKTISIILVVASILSIFLAMRLTVSAMDTMDNPLDEMWRFFLVTPIPLCSIAYSFILRKNRYSWLKSLIVGGIMLMILCLFGCFTFLSGNVFNDSQEPVLCVEETLQIDLPEVKRIQTMNWMSGEQASAAGLYYSSDVFFEMETADFEALIESDPRWLTVLPTELSGLLSVLDTQRTFDYVLLYNLETGECNTLPEENGTYRFIGLYYKQASRHLMIREYEVEYVK